MAKFLSKIGRFSLAASLLLGFFVCVSTPLLACSWDYPIWIPRSKKAAPLYRFIREGKAGYINQSGKIVIAPTLDFYGNDGGEFYDGLMLKGVAYGPYLDTKGKVALDTGLERNWEFSEGLAVAMAKDSDKWGYIDPSGKFAITPRFATYPNGYVSSFSDGLARIEVSAKHGFIDRTGDFVIPPKYLYAGDFREGLATVIVAAPCVRYDETAVCDSPVVLGTPLAEERPARCRYSFIDKSGALIGSDSYEQAQDFAEGLAAVKVEGKWGYINKTGRLVIEPKFDQAAPFSEGLARIKLAELYGFIDSQGAIIIAPQYRQAESFADGFAPVCQTSDEKNESDCEDYHYLDKQGHRAFKEKYALASEFFKGLAHVKLKRPKQNPDDDLDKGTFAYINTSGQRVFTYAARYED